LTRFIPLLEPLKKHWGPQPDTVRLYTIEERNPGEIGLFDEVAHPVTLIGTSYSAGEVWNFAGFLRAAFQAEVLNLAGEGRGPFLPMVEYLESSAIQDIPPDLIVWEIPERYLPVSYDLPQTFGQAYQRQPQRQTY
jgi:alginate O-acetyltransferase complex protein AlgJ